MTPFELFMKLLWPVGAALTWFFVRPHFGLLATIALAVVGAFVTQLAAVFIVAAVTSLRERSKLKP